MVFFDRHTNGAFGIRLNEILIIWPSEKNGLLFFAYVAKLEKIMIFKPKLYEAKFAQNVNVHNIKVAPK